MNALSVEDYARHAARHSLSPDGASFRQERIDNLSQYGVIDENTLAEHALDVLLSQNTICACLPYGREYYANDETDTIVILNTLKPERSTVFHNDHKELTASDRLCLAVREDIKSYKKDIQIRRGGFELLEQDRSIEIIRKIKPF